VAASILPDIKSLLYNPYPYKTGKKHLKPDFRCARAAAVINTFLALISSNFYG
jgi:hypothetical protein